MTVASEHLRRQTLFEFAAIPERLLGSHVLVWSWFL